MTKLVVIGQSSRRTGGGRHQVTSEHKSDSAGYKRPGHFTPLQANEKNIRQTAQCKDGHDSQNVGSCFVSLTLLDIKCRCSIHPGSPYASQPLSRAARAAGQFSSVHVVLQLMNGSFPCKLPLSLEVGFTNTCEVKTASSPVRDQEKDPRISIGYHVFLACPQQNQCP